ncbi:MAG: DUF1570 domain-containing protein [Planctomycetota bacterium]
MRSSSTVAGCLMIGLCALLADAPTAQATIGGESNAVPSTSVEPLSSLQRKLGPSFRPYRAKGFVVLSDAEPKWVRARLGLLGRTKHQFERFFDRLEIDLSEPPEELRCVIFAEHADYQRFAQETDKTVPPWAGGYYAPRANRVVMFDERTSPVYLDAMDNLDDQRGRIADAEARRLEAARSGDAEAARAFDSWLNGARGTVGANAAAITEHFEAVSRAKLVHEAVHMLSYNTGLQSPYRLDPIWFTEGLATAFETDGKAGGFGPRHPYLPREDEVDTIRAEGPRLEAIAMVSAHRIPDDTVGPAYTYSYALFTHVARKKPEDLARFIRALRTREGIVEDGLSLFREHFGEPASVARAAGLGR